MTWTGREPKAEYHRQVMAAACTAAVFNISIDYLLIDGIPRRPLHAAQDALGDHLAAVAELRADDLAALLSIIDGLVAKNRLKALAGGLS
jgi:hypothetical protein